VEEVLPHLGDKRRAGQSCFRHLLESVARGSARTAWKWLRERPFAGDGLAPEHLDLILKQRITDRVFQVWASCLWAQGRLPGSQYFVQWRFSRTHRPARRLQRPVVIAVWLQGSENLNYRHTAQTVCARTREYVFQAYERTRDLTTDEGVCFHIFYPESSVRFDIYTARLRWTNDWIRPEKGWRIRAVITRLILVQVCRMPSRKFDNNIRGSVARSCVTESRELGWKGDQDSLWSIT
jgi:hypothetical protein